MWTLRSWLSTDLGNKHEQPVRLNDAEAMKQIGKIAQIFSKYPNGTVLMDNDEGDIMFSITNQDNGYSMTYCFREEKL